MNLTVDARSPWTKRKQSGSGRERRKPTANSAAQEHEEAEDRATAEHSRSPWNGSYPKFVDAVKRRLNDPDSFEHDGSRASRIGSDGYHEVTMLVSRPDSFRRHGAAKTIGRVANETCRTIGTRVK